MYAAPDFSSTSSNTSGHDDPVNDLAKYFQLIECFSSQPITAARGPGLEGVAYRDTGRDNRLTDVQGNVFLEIIG